MSLVPEYTNLPVTWQIGGTDDRPHVEVRAGVVVVAGFVALFLAWAAIAPLDKAATADGRVSVSGHSQEVEHREGGVVAVLNVREGQIVKAGDVLVELAPEDVGAQVHSLKAQILSLQAQHARLAAEMQGAAVITWPDAFKTLTGDELVAAKEVIGVQQALFDNSKSALIAQISANAHRASGIAAQIEGTQRQLEANTSQQASLGQQLTGVRSLAQKGFASLNSVRVLERSAADLAGAHGALQANVADYRQQIASTGLLTQNAIKAHLEADATALRDTDDQLSALAPKLDAATRQLERGTFRAQSDGIVTGLSVFGVGNVVQPGQRLMEVVPLKPVLVVQGRLPASQIQGVNVGREAKVRFMTMEVRGAPVLTGKITSLSADSFVDDKTGQSYYTVDVTVSKKELDALSQAKNAASAVRPGVPVEVMIPLQKRTALDYLMGPLFQALWKK